MTASSSASQHQRARRSRTVMLMINVSSFILLARRHAPSRPAISLQEGVGNSSWREDAHVGYDCRYEVWGRVVDLVAKRARRRRDGETISSGHAASLPTRMRTEGLSASCSALMMRACDSPDCDAVVAAEVVLLST